VWPQDSDIPLLQSTFYTCWPPNILDLKWSLHQCASPRITYLPYTPSTCFCLITLSLTLLCSCKQLPPCMMNLLLVMTEDWGNTRSNFGDSTHWSADQCPWPPIPVLVPFPPSGDQYDEIALGMTFYLHWSADQCSWPTIPVLVPFPPSGQFTSCLFGYSAGNIDFDLLCCQNVCFITAFVSRFIPMNSHWLSACAALLLLWSPFALVRFSPLVCLFDKIVGKVANSLFFYCQPCNNQPVLDEWLQSHKRWVGAWLWIIWRCFYSNRATLLWLKKLGKVY